MPAEKIGTGIIFTRGKLEALKTRDAQLLNPQTLNSRIEKGEMLKYDDTPEYDNLWIDELPYNLLISALCQMGQIHIRQLNGEMFSDTA